MFMAACGAMNLKMGVLATIVALLLGACSNVVDGRAVISVPRPGSPIQWAACKAAESDSTRVPAGAECGMLSVPVDYAKPDGDVAQIAMIRFKATGQKIGSLIVNPGGPGESGVEAAASLAPTLPQSVRDGFDLVGFDPRGVANSTPAAWCNSDADNDRLRADPTVDYTPEGVAHIEKDIWNVTLMGEKGGANWDSSQIFTDHGGYQMNMTPGWIGKWDIFEYKMKHFVEVCRDGRKNESPAEHGLMVQKMLDGVYASSEKGAEVRIE